MINGVEEDVSVQNEFRSLPLNAKQEVEVWPNYPLVMKLCWWDLRTGFSLSVTCICGTMSGQTVTIGRKSLLSLLITCEDDLKISSLVSV